VRCGEKKSPAMERSKKVRRGRTREEVLDEGRLRKKSQVKYTPAGSDPGRGGVGAKKGLTVGLRGTPRPQARLHGEE